MSLCRNYKQIIVFFIPKKLKQNVEIVQSYGTKLSSHGEMKNNLLVHN